MADQTNIQAGTVFAGDFRIVRPLSAGGMGAVYAAEQISTGKPRALKVMLPQLVADASLRKRFEQEARIGSRIESEHVVEVVGAGVDPILGLPWLAMEMLTGEDLAQVVQARGAVPLAEMLVLFEQLCHAVGAAHRVGVVHRDLKPENIFLAQSKRAGGTFLVKVLDFGIAKVVAEASTKQTAAMGSPIWMAPEQADQSPITPATDVWALGLLAFFLLTGKPFWKSANNDEATIPQVLKEVLFEPIVPASLRSGEMGGGLPPGFDAWFARCVAREPSARFADATEAGAALVAALVATPVAVTESPGISYAATAMPDGPGGGSTAGAAPAVAPPPAVVRTAPASYGPQAGPAAAAAFGTGPSGSFAVAREPPRARKVPPAVAAAVVAGAVLLGSSAAGGVWWLTRHASGTATATGLASSALDAGATAAATTVPLAPLPTASVNGESDHGAALDGGPTVAATSPADPAPHRTPQAVTPKPQPAAATTPAVTAVATAPAPPANTFVLQPAAPPPTPPAPAGRSVADLANSAVSADWWTARRILEPKVLNNTATVEEVKLLHKVCLDQHDRACLKLCKLTLAGKR